MKHIKIINALYLTNEGLVSKYSNGKPHNFFIKQGCLDGACAPYSASMLLMILGVLKRSDLEVNKHHKKSTKIGKIIDLFFQQKGLVRDGYNFEQLTQELQVFKNAYDIQYHNEEESVLSIIENHINSENPVLISVEFSSGAHALVAVGLEYNEKEEITKILCIDPGYDHPKITYWNSVIDIEKRETRKYKYTWLNNDTPVKLSDIITFDKK